MVKAAAGAEGRATMLQRGRTASAWALQDRFVQGGNVVSLAYGDLSTFFRGLEGQVGTPDPKLVQAMRREHCAECDSRWPFVTSNYAIETTSEVEYHFVAEAEAGLSMLGLQVCNGM